jgi:glycosyltransferase involved in cell wall biosynthesis
MEEPFENKASRIAVVVPVFNDWESLSRLIDEIDACQMPEAVKFSLFIINDSSTDPPRIFFPFRPFIRISEIELINLACNLGHQRAIAVGLVEVYNRKAFDSILVMDSDGEDRPSEIARLYAEAGKRPSHIICAQRKQRPGHTIFRLWYLCYKILFRMLTGAQIDFGNFCLIPGEKLEALINQSSIWNNLAGTIARERIPLVKIPSDRGRRYAGKSKMNFVSLVMHGLSAISIYSDVVMVRLVIVTVVIIAVTIFGIAWVLAEKLLTNLAIPGWATSAIGALATILSQALLLFTISTFNLMNNRSAKVVLPRTDAMNFVLSRKSIFSAELAHMQNGHRYDISAA